MGRSEDQVSTARSEGATGAPYDAYVRFNLRLQELRARSHDRVAQELRRDCYRDHGEFIKQLAADGGQRFLMSRDEFGEWWAGLELEQQNEYAELYARPVHESLEETNTAILQDFFDRQPEPWQTGR